MLTTTTTKQREQVEAELQGVGNKEEELAAQKRKLKEQLAALEQQEAQERAAICGEMVRHMGLDTTDPATLMGALHHVAEQLRNPATAQQYAAQGAALYETFQKSQKRPRRRKTSKAT